MINYYTTTESPVGPLLLTSDGAALTGLYMTSNSSRSTTPVALDAWRIEPWKCKSPGLLSENRAQPFAETKRQLKAYFTGELTEFDLPLALDGTGFQRLVWQALTQIPYGTTTSYGELARQLGNPNGSRAVGLANGSNPISIIVPCHRVIGSNGRLTGYGGGLPRKAALLDFEFSVRLNGPCAFPATTNER